MNYSTPTNRWANSGGNLGHTRPYRVCLGIDELTGAFQKAQRDVAEFKTLFHMSIVACWLGVSSRVSNDVVF